MPGFGGYFFSLQLVVFDQAVGSVDDATARSAGLGLDR
jgi:hypothetical protein